MHPSYSRICADELPREASTWTDPSSRSGSSCTAIFRMAKGRAWTPMWCSGHLRRSVPEGAQARHQTSTALLRRVAQRRHKALRERHADAAGYPTSTASASRAMRQYGMTPAAAPAQLWTRSASPALEANKTRPVKLIQLRALLLRPRFRPRRGTSVESLTRAAMEKLGKPVLWAHLGGDEVQLVARSLGPGRQGPWRPTRRPTSQPYAHQLPWSGRCGKRSFFALRWGGPGLHPREHTS